MFLPRFRTLLALVVFAGCASATRTSSQATSAPQQPVVHTYRTIGGTALSAYVFAPQRKPSSAPAPAILLFHGGGWAAGSPEWTFGTAQRFAAAGVVAIPIQYRLSADSITPIDALGDVCAAFQWARRQAASLGLNPNRVAAHGVSAGGHLAATAATNGCGNTEGAYKNGGPDALVLWSPALDMKRDGYFQHLLLKRAPAVDYSPVDRVHQGMPPTTIVQGDKDSLTPLAVARQFCDRAMALGARCELLVYSGVGHLLTRNLANQESDFDVDPVAREDGSAKQLQFLRALWLR